MHRGHNRELSSIQGQYFVHKGRCLAFNLQILGFFGDDLPASALTVILGSELFRYVTLARSRVDFRRNCSDCIKDYGFSMNSDKS